MPKTPSFISVKPSKRAKIIGSRVELSHSRLDEVVIFFSIRYNIGRSGFCDTLDTLCQSVSGIRATQKKGRSASGAINNMSEGASVSLCSNPVGQ